MGLDHFRNLFLDQDVTPNFLTESVIVSIAESEESAVLSWKFGSNQFESDGNLLVRLDGSIDNKGIGLKIIPVSLNEQSILRPFSFATVSESPFFQELLKRSYDEFISEILFDKSSIVDDFLLCRSFLGSSTVLRVLYLALSDLRLVHKNLLALVKLNFLIKIIIRAL